MKVSIHIVSFVKHFHWLKYCLRSIEKYATGFHEISLWIPHEDVAEVQKLEQEYKGQVPLRIQPYEDWPGKGMLKHFDLVIHADQCCPEADFILHMDSDCIFLEPVTPEDYFVGGKPVLMYADYEWLCRIEPAIRCWQEASYRALGWKPQQETMRRHPAVHPRETYLLTRQCIERHTNTLISDFIKAQQNEHPAGFAEYPTLGAYAWRFLSQKYHWINQENEVRPKDKILQGWTHQVDLNAPLEIWHSDQKVTIVPNEMFAKYLS